MRERVTSSLRSLLLSWPLLSLGSGSKGDQPSLLMLFQGASCLQLSLCQHFVARKAAAAERNPYLAAGALRPSLSHTSFAVAVSTAIYFPWSLFYYLLLAAGLAAAWEGCPRGAELGCSCSRRLGRTWRSCTGSAGSIPVAHRSGKKGNGL